MAAARRQTTIGVATSPTAIFLLLLAASVGGRRSHRFDCDFEGPCSHWHWRETGFKLTNDSGVAGGRDGQFLWSSGTFVFPSGSDSGSGGWPRRSELLSDPLHLGSLHGSGRGDCALQFWLQTGNGASLMVSMRSLNHTLVLKTFPQLQGWREIRESVSARTQGPFQLILEAVLEYPESHLTIDHIRLTGCSDDDENEDFCGLSGDSTGRGFLCLSSGKCLGRDKICDLHSDCPPDADDEHQECDRLSQPAYCSFESGQCGWRNTTSASATGFSRSNGFDHTFNNESGHYMITSFSSKSTFGNEAELDSVQFEAPPYYHRNVHSAYYNSCQVRFWFAQEGRSTSLGHLYLRCVQEAPAETGCGRDIWQQTIKRPPVGQGRVWKRALVAIPPLSHSYSLRFAASRGTKPNLNVLLDDITLSPECFGLGVPENESRTEEPMIPLNDLPTNITRRYTFGSCGAVGARGPRIGQCRTAYGNHNSTAQVTISDQRPGVQLWTVPETGQYMIFAVGASGGTGVRNSNNPSRGAMVRGLFNFTQGEVLAILVGQRGTDACSPHTSRELQHQCHLAVQRTRRGVSDLRKSKKPGGGGGGGGATFIYKPRGMIPLLVASGAGGLSADPEDPSVVVDPDGAGPNTTLLPINGAQVMGPEGPHRVISGPGGGWNDTTSLRESGRSLLEGSAGGESCNPDWSANGGFGGGGGSCTGGGGGGGYRGGDAGSGSNGQGGVSFVSVSASYPLSEPSFNEGQGSVAVFPTQRGCSCQHLCLPLDLQEANRPASSPAFLCICPNGQALDSDGRSCLGNQGPLTKQVGSDSFQLPTHHLVVIILCILVTVAVILFFLLLALNRYRRKQTRELSHEPLRSNPEVQLSRLRQAAAAGGGGSAAGAVTEYNPNYEFGGSTCTLQDLREIPRENLTLVKALGQGAFGEVYQGYLSNAPGEISEIAVAVKTLPEVSSGQAEQDFMLEALIMSKFTHPNIVRFLGVCFQKLPRFIVLELLPGGDLKSFLRETRPKPAKPSPLSMVDLLRLAIDVAKGCQYLEENHFIHRDIAARNCLLTSKDVDRVVKIADFGMARDIYKADYYRKGGKAMLPVKWMPPEAFLDGVFTSKTDVWSFGVLLWEVLSMGYMPYPGRGNQEVMQLVTSGGRLEPPANCPGPVYHIMMQCWHPLPEERPAFATILERLGYCVQDPDVVSAPLPVFHRPPSMEKDATLMRPPDGSDGCLQVIQQHGPELQSPGSEDYLIPMPSSNYSLSTERTELQSSAESVDKLLRLDEELLEGATGGSDLCWPEHETQAETCFSKGSLEALPLAPASPRETQPQPLDAAALNRLTNRPLPYVNVDVTGMSSFEDNAANC